MPIKSETADGETIVEGMHVWFYSWDYGRVVERTVAQVKPRGVFLRKSTYSIHPRHLYAHRERAEAALNAGK